MLHKVVYQQIAEKVNQLNYDEASETLKFLDFIFYKREAEEDAILAKQIKNGLDDDFLDVKSALNYLKELDSVENKH